MNLRCFALFVLFAGLWSEALGQGAGRPLPTEPIAHRDLAYIEGGHERQRLDLFLPSNSDGPWPVIIWVHGGGWQNGSKEQCLPLRSGYLEKGYAVASIGYRLSQHATYPAQIEDCKSAIRYLRANAKKYRLDPERFGAWGSSAGGHLGALLGTTGDVVEFDTGPNADQSSRVQAVCDFYGPTDFVAFGNSPGYERHSRPDSPESKLLGGAAKDKPEQAARANPISFVSADDPPFLIIHGDQDRVVPLNQSELLFAALKKAGVSARFHTLNGAGHGGLGFSSPEIQEMVSAFFNERLKDGSNAAEAIESQSAASAETARTPQRPPGADGRRPQITWEQIISREDSDGDGKITRQEYKGPPALFDRIDQNRDGLINKEEFAGWRARSQGRPNPNPPPAPEEKTPASASAATSSIPKIEGLTITGNRWTCEADGQRLSGILVKPKGKGPFPAILISHGLGSNAAQFGTQKATEFSKWGLVSIATDLTHARGGAESDRTTFGASDENIRRALVCLEVLRRQTEFDPKRVAAYGNSMGAFLTIRLAAEYPDRIAAAAITAGGVIPRKGFPAPTEGDAEKIRTPFLILHGSADETVPAANSAALKAILDRHQVPNERQLFENVGHGLHVEKSREVYRLMKAWFERVGLLKG